MIARGAEMVYTATFDQLVTDLMRDRHMTRPQAEAAAKQTAGTAALGFAQHWADKSVQKTEARIQKEGYAGYVPGPNTHQKSGERPTKPVSEKAKAARAAHAEVRDGANVIGRDLAFEACIAALDLGR